MRKKHESLYEQANSLEEIQEALQCLVKELLTTLSPEKAAALSDADTVDLTLLAELSYNDLQRHAHPVRLLSDICRLLFKAGDRSSLRYGLALSQTLHSFKCAQDESWHLAHIYRGIAQIGLGEIQLGIKNVSSGLNDREGFVLSPVDRALGYWALCSAAIRNRNLKLALNFARQWQQAAERDGLREESLRAGITQFLLALVVGERESAPAPLSEQFKDIPTGWRGVVDVLEDWTRKIETPSPTPAIMRDTETSAGPYPLFLGFDWRHHDMNGALPGANFQDFAVLCDIRRTFCCAEAIEQLSTEQIEEYADCLAHWELPRPLYDFETILKNKALDRNLHYVMTRLLGRRVLDTVTNKSAVDPEVARQNEAVILVMDVRKFSALSEHRTPEEIFDLLNPIFKIMHEELEQAGGTILEFIGDCIIIVFNTFKEQPAQLAEIFRCTMQALERIRVHNAMSLRAGLPEIQVGIGLNKGPVALGYLGGLPRCHLTVLGNTINLASRIESSSKELPGDLIVSEFCFDDDRPALWTEPELVNFALRDVGRHSMRNIERPVHLYGLSPLIRSWVDFVPMGFVASPEEGVVYLDTGNSGETGIIDHHHGSHAEHSACELLLAHPELLLEHLKDIRPSQREFRLHTTPDLDCASTLYAAYELLEKNPRLVILKKLAAYVSKIDQGRIPQPEDLHDSLVGVCIAHQKLTAKRYGRQLTNFHLLEAGLRVIDAAVYLMEVQGEDADFASIFQSQPEWFPEERQLIRQDRLRYQGDLLQRSHCYRARVKGIETRVTGLWLDHPQSDFFKLWARNDPDAPDGMGYQFLVVDWSTAEKSRFILSVDPDSGTNLNGLGQLLERHEAEKRRQLGKTRPIHPIRYPADNSDPWYFGQGHQYTIIDSPWGGTVLTAEEVQAIHRNWIHA